MGGKFTDGAIGADTAVWQQPPQQLGVVPGRRRGRARGCAPPQHADQPPLARRGRRPQPLGLCGRVGLRRARQRRFIVVYLPPCLQKLEDLYFSSCCLRVAVGGHVCIRLSV